MMIGNFFTNEKNGNKMLHQAKKIRMMNFILN